MSKTKNENRHHLTRRRAGILLHPTSLPGPCDSGDLGPNAYWFVDFLANSGFTVWQFLPMGPPHADLSPYQTQSIHAGDTRLISVDQLVHEGWLEGYTPPDTECPPKQRRQLREHGLRQAFDNFQQKAKGAVLESYHEFTRRHAAWLDDYALFRVLKSEYEDTAWWDWKPAYRDRDPEALATARHRFANEIEQHRFEQFLFFRQWSALKSYANERGVLLFGDLPIFVAADSVEVWAGRENFRLDPDGRPSVVAGVPPDYFSATGQRWGNPHYDWDYMQSTGFHWWIKRLETQNILFDMVRIDHFRGFEAYWEIPASAPTAMEGRWVKAPGEALFKVLQNIDSVPLVAEDLGVITEEVTALRKQFNIPGMRILQFAFDGGPENPYLPHNHGRNCVVYTGTHDNNTSLGWFNELTEEQRLHVCEYLNADPESMPWPLVRCAFASVARLAIVPMQDLLGADGNHRMNRPGTSDPLNWCWRFQWSDLPHDLHRRMRLLLALYGRV